MSARIGTQVGLSRRATILKNNNDGTILVGLDQAGGMQLTTQLTIPAPAAYYDPSGGFLGGKPDRGSSVLISQGAAGSWYVESYLPSSGRFDNTNSLSSSSVEGNQMGLLKTGRILGKIGNGTHWFLDPKAGFRAGDSSGYIQIDPKNSIISHNLETELAFTEATRYVDGTVKRDLTENSLRNVLGSTLDSQSYDDHLHVIGLDPTMAIQAATIGAEIRNPPLNEVREMTYEFGNSFEFTSDADESTRYIDPKNFKIQPRVSRRSNRADTLSMSLEAPNQLIETIRGTVTDSFGNILDINRVALPIGKIDDLSLVRNTSKAAAFNAIRAQLRKSIAYHFEINTRKGTADTTVPYSGVDVTDVSNYARNESKFFFEVDKEGSFKLNVPASSEVGNVPLLTRYENFSNLLAQADGTTDPNTFIQSSTGQDIYLKNFAGNAKIKLSGSGDALDGYASPLNFIDSTPIGYGTAFHDITAACSEYTKNAFYLKNGLKLINFDKNNHLNTDFKPLDDMVTNNIIVSGAKANAGGRSGAINFDGFITLNVGANTIDRQSMWCDFAGGVVTTTGRDIRGNSLVSNFDGDVLIQVGGAGIGNTFDTRFANQNDSYRNGTFEIRVLCNQQLHIFRISGTGLDVISAGTITFSAQQDIVMRTNSSFKIEAENIMLFSETAKRLVNRYPNTTI